MWLLTPFLFTGESFVACLLQILAFLPVVRLDYEYRCSEGWLCSLFRSTSKEYCCTLSRG